MSKKKKGTSPLNKLSKKNRKAISKALEKAMKIAMEMKEIAQARRATRVIDVGIRRFQEEMERVANKVEKKETVKCLSVNPGLSKDFSIRPVEFEPIVPVMEKSREENWQSTKKVGTQLDIPSPLLEKVLQEIANKASHIDLNMTITLNDKN